MHPAFNRESTARVRGGLPNERPFERGSGERAGADPSGRSLQGRKHRRRCTRLLSGRARLESVASHHLQERNPLGGHESRRPPQGRPSLRSPQPRRPCQSTIGRPADRRSATSARSRGHTTVVQRRGPRIPNPMTQVRVLPVVPSPCRLVAKTARRQRADPGSIPGTGSMHRGSSSGRAPGFEPGG